MALKAIETQYNGYRFRSRLEARWAVFFDAMGITWEYEKEGFDLGAAGWYLPDFWLPELKQFIEVKGERGDGEFFRKARTLEAQSGFPVVCLIGSIPESCRDDFDILWTGRRAVLPFNYHPSRLFEEGMVCAVPPAGVLCPLCRTEFVHFEHPIVEVEDGRPSRLLIPMWCETGCTWEFEMTFHGGNSRGTVKNVSGYAKSMKVAFGIDPCDVSSSSEAEIDSALMAARAARFEHGECG